MKKTISIVCLSLILSSNAWSRDDSVIDLSVLKEISPTDSELALPDNGPRFPIVKHKISVKPKPMKVKKIEPAAAVPLPKIEDQTSVPFVDDNEKPLEIKVTPEEKVLVDEINSYEEKLNTEENKEEKIEQVPTSAIDVEVENPEEKTESAPQSSEPLIVTPPSNFINFDDDATELTDHQKINVLEIIDTFSNPVENRIGILSYNFDDKIDPFKRKRQSLTRATEIRHLLLSQGYKNFSIKIINVDKESNKKNSVELVEIKK